MSNASMRERVWLITGCSTGLGRALAIQAIEAGYRVAVTARDISSVEDLVKGRERVAAFALDVTSKMSVDVAIREATSHFGRIDVLVNNAGIGHFSPIEEADDAAVRHMFDVNVFGLCSVVNAVLPGMRERRSGHIVNVASAGGIVAFPGVGYYNATKWAVFGLSEALQKEVAPLGIRVTVAAPSGMRVRDASDAAHFALPPIQNDDYAETVGAMRRSLLESFGRQPGNPIQAARAIVQAVEDEGSPFRLFLGKAAMNYARQRSRELCDDAKIWEAVGLAVDFDDAEDERLT
jgi:NADP-dependent 3-hydroxy acid dehydrogenase YdfG